MSLATALVAIKSANSTLNALVSTRFHPDVLPQGVTLPAIRFQSISRRREYTFNSTPTLQHVRVQIDGYAATSAARSTLASAIRGAFNRYRSTSIGGESVQDIRIENEWEGMEMLDTNSAAYRVSVDMIVDMAEV